MRSPVPQIAVGSLPVGPSLRLRLRQPDWRSFRRTAPKNLPGNRPYPQDAPNGRRLEGERSRRQNASRNERKGCGILQQECRDANTPASVPRPNQERYPRRPAHSAQMHEVGNVAKRAPSGRVDMALPGRDSARPTADLACRLAANRNGRKRYAGGRRRVGRPPGTRRGSR